MTFSREQSKIDAIAIKQRRARTMARLQKPEYKTKHPAECRDASGDTPNYTILNKRIKEECEKKQLQVEKFRSKLHAKQ